MGDECGDRISYRQQARWIGTHANSAVANSQRRVSNWVQQCGCVSVVYILGTPSSSSVAHGPRLKSLADYTVARGAFYTLKRVFYITGVK